MTAWKAFVNSLTRELASISRSPWDMTMLMAVPCLVVVLFGSMFYHGIHLHGEVLKHLFPDLIPKQLLLF